jgi:hypothetical protein
MKLAILPDLKTERSDVGQPLPAPLRILPVAFLASILGAIGISAYSMLQIKVAQDAAKLAREAETAQQAEMTRIGGETTAVQKEVNNANEVKDWVASTNQLQPMLTAITRAITNENTITQLSLSRREDMNAQVQMALHISAAKGQQQVDQIRTALSGSLGMRSFSENINIKGKNELSFDCTWIHTESAESKR